MQNFTQKIYTKLGITKVSVFSNERVLHIGSGNSRLPGAETIDVLDLPNVDIVHDLESFPWPYEDNAFDLIFAHSVFEHFSDPVKIMEEMWRVLKPGGRAVITVPYFRSVDAYCDPTHKHFFTSGSFNYYLDEQTTLAGYRYTDRRFKKVGFWYGWPQPSINPLVRIFKSFIHKHQNFYDSHLSLLLPLDIVIWELEAIKP